MRAARFAVITPECIRLEYSESGRFVDEPSLLAAARQAPGPGDLGAAVVAQGDGPWSIDTGRIRLEYAPDGRPFHAGNLRAWVRFEDGRPDAEWVPGMPQRENLGGAMRSLDGVRGSMPLPDGLISLDGWYVLDDSGTPLLVDGWARERPEGAGIDWYFFGYGRDYAAAMNALAAVGGRVPMPRRVMMGSWYSRYWAYTSEEIKEIVDGYRGAMDRPFPLDVMVLDMDWHKSPPSPPPGESGLPGWTGWSWNRELLPDAEGLLRWLHDSGLAVTLNLHPADGVRWFEDRYEAFMRRLGRDPAARETVPFDAGNRRYMGALLEEVHAPLEKDGVDFWWMDWQQEEWARSVRGLSNAGWLNAVYFAWMGRGNSTQHTTHSTQQSQRRGASFGRWGGWGDHRHPVHFSGDVHSGWRALGFVVEFTVRSSHSGCFFWSHDIGGHFGARDEEAMARWAQFGALSAAMRVHSARSARLDRRPWLCERKYAEAIRRAYALRSRLMPTIYAAARACHDQMRPLIRGMHMDWPWEEEAYEWPGQYMLGELLVAPVTEAGVGEGGVGTVEVWFPGATEEGTGDGEQRERAEGSRWYRFQTGERYEAGSEAIVSAGIDEIPVFVRGGAPVVMQQEFSGVGMAREAMREMTVRVYPGAVGCVGRGSVYEDDGETTGYLNGEYARTEVAVQWNGEHEDTLISFATRSARRQTVGGVRVEIAPAVGSFGGQLERRSYAIEIGAVKRVWNVRLDGERAEVVEFDDRRRMARVRVMERAIRERVVVEMEFEEADAEAVARERRERRVAAAFGRGGQEGLGLPQSRRTQWHAKRHEIASGIGVRGEDGVFRLHDSWGLMDRSEVQVEIVDHIGGREEVRWAGSVQVTPGRAARVMDATPGLAMPALGLRAARAVRASFSVAGEPRVLQAQARTLVRPLMAWRVVGPFAFDHMRTIDEQRAGPENAPADAGAVYRGAGGAQVRWQPGRSTWEEAVGDGAAGTGGHDQALERAMRGGGWAVDLRRMYSGGSIMAYGVTHVWSPREQRATLVLESGDRMEAWVNEEKVFSMDTGDMMDSAAGEAPVRLRDGWNRIAVKVSEGGGGFGFTAALDGEAEVREAVDPGESC